MAEFALLSSEAPEEYETWLVSSFEKLRAYKPRAIGIVVLPGSECDDACTITAYFHADLRDKHLMSAAINDDATCQLVEANLGYWLGEEDEE